MRKHQPPLVHQFEQTRGNNEPISTVNYYPNEYETELQRRRQSDNT